MIDTIDDERQIIGCIVASGGRALDDLDDLQPGDFLDPKLEDAFTVARQLHESGTPVTTVTLAEHLTGRKHALRASDLAALDARVTVWVEAAHIAAHLRDQANRRRLASVGNMLIARSADPAASAEGLVEDGRALLDAAIAQGTSDLPTFLDRVMSANDRWQQTDDAVLPTGWIDLDEKLTGGLRKGHLCVIGARPAVGKSVAATVAAANIAQRGAGVLLCSLEMSGDEVTDRVMSNVAGTPLAHLTGRNLDDLDWQRQRNALGKVGGWQLWVDDRSGITVNQIRSRARTIAHRGRLDMIIVDYLQLVRPADPRIPREQQVASVSRSLKHVARELEVPVVALAQVNRGSTTRQDKRPMMSDLRESGSIEADADEIVLLHRDDDDPNLLGEIEFIVVKNRHGATGKVELAFQPDRARISNLGRQTA